MVVWDLGTVFPLFYSQVGLWLGANVMLEYDLAEAKEILLSNLSLAETTLADAEETLAYLKEQTTTVEVSLARLHNLNVKRNQAAVATSASGGSASTNGPRMWL